MPSRKMATSAISSATPGWLLLYFENASESSSCARQNSKAMSVVLKPFSILFCMTSFWSCLRSTDILLVFVRDCFAGYNHEFDTRFFENLFRALACVIVLARHETLDTGIDHDFRTG